MSGACFSCVSADICNFVFVCVAVVIKKLPISSFTQQPVSTESVNLFPLINEKFYKVEIYSTFNSAVWNKWNIIFTLTIFIKRHGKIKRITSTPEETEHHLPHGSTVHCGPGQWCC